MGVWVRVPGGALNIFMKVINMKTIKDIFDMIDLFYANKHYHDRLKRQHEKRERENHARVANR